MFVFLFNIFSSNEYPGAPTVETAAPKPKPSRQTRQVAIAEEVNVEAPKSPATPCRAAATTGTAIRCRGHQEQPGSDRAVNATPPPMPVPPPAAAELPAAVLPAGVPPNPVPTSPTTPIYDYGGNPFIAATHTPHDHSLRPVTPTTEQRFWVFSPSGSTRSHGTPRAGPHSPARRSPRRSPRQAKAFKKADDVRTFFEDSEDTRSCLFCKYVFKCY